jgi:hypothetical protein
VRPNGTVIEAYQGHPECLRKLGFASYAAGLRAGLVRVGYSGSRFWAGVVGVQFFELSSRAINRVEDILHRLVLHPHTAVSVDWAITETKQPYGHIQFENIWEAREKFKKRATRILAEGRN